MIKKLIIFLIAAALIFGAWYFFIRMTKDKAIKLIVEGGMFADANALKGWDEQTLISWAKAFKKAELTFTSNGKTYKVQGGKAL